MLEKEIEKHELELQSLSEQVEGLRKGLKGLTEEDQKTIAIHKQYETSEQTIEEWLTEISSVRNSIKGLKDEISGYPTGVSEETKLPNDEQDILLDIQTQVKSLHDEIRIGIETLESKLDPNNTTLSNLSASIEKLKAKLVQHKTKYEAAKQKSTSQQTTLTQIQKIEDRLKEIRKALSDKKQGITKTGDSEARFDALKEEWFSVHRARADLLATQCAKLGELSDNSLRAILGRGCETREMEEVLKKIIVGANIRKEKIEELSKRIKEAADSVQEWNLILLELEAIASSDPSSNPTAPLPNTPILAAAGFTANDLRKMAEKLTSENWIEVLLVQLGDLPRFEYKTREGEFIDFVDASAGQQATALMHVLLNQEGPPLIIDQPEDDLDNQMVSDIAALIWQAKKKRQLIFTSHNANIVVNGDAELVVCCGYKITGDQSKGEIKNQGAIDIEEIRTEITKVMEGGEEAFKLRKEKYGF